MRMRGSVSTRSLDSSSGLYRQLDILEPQRIVRISLSYSLAFLADLQPQPKPKYDCVCTVTQKYVSAIIAVSPEFHQHVQSALKCLLY